MLDVVIFSKREYFIFWLFWVRFYLEIRVDFFVRVGMVFFGRVSEGGKKVVWDAMSGWGYFWFWSDFKFSRKIGRGRVVDVGVWVL